MAKGKRKEPRLGAKAPGPKAPRVPATPGPSASYDREKLSWQFGFLDEDHPRWGWGRLTTEERWAILACSEKSRLRQLETMTWHEVKKASGGKRKGTNSHSIPITHLCKEAQKRLVDLLLDDRDELFSLRLSGTVRVWGIRDAAALKLLWYDTDHSVCPSTKH